MEQQLILLGATAIEDRLGPNVPESIQYLREVSFFYFTFLLSISCYWIQSVYIFLCWSFAWIFLISWMNRQELKCGSLLVTSKKQQLTLDTLVDCWQGRWNWFVFKQNVMKNVKNNFKMQLRSVRYQFLFEFWCLFPITEMNPKEWKKEMLFFLVFKRWIVLMCLAKW